MLVLEQTRPGSVYITYYIHIDYVYLLAHKHNFRLNHLVISKSIPTLKPAQQPLT